jgi:hypothetical protein
MPSLNKKNLKYFHMAKAIQEGKVKLPEKDLKLFVRCIKELCHPRYQGLPDPAQDLRYDITGGGGTGGSPIEPMYLEQDMEDPSTTEQNPVAKTFKQQGNFENYVNGFTGLELKPKEMESITNYTNAKPTNMEKAKSKETGEDVVISVRYENSDEFSNNTITVIKKLRQGNDLVFTTFQSSTQQSAGGAEPQKPEETGENEIIVSKSRSFRDEIEGGKVLSDILQKLEI